MKSLQLDGITVVRDGHTLLEHIKLEVNTGKITGIISDNPERLQLLLNVIGGVETEQSGRILFTGDQWTSNQRLQGVGIAREQVSLIDSLSVLDNLFLSNRALYTWMGFIQRSKRKKHAGSILRKLSIQVSLDSTMQTVEPNRKVLLDLVRAIIKDPDFLVFNGVTRAMNLRQYDAFQTVLKSLRTAVKGIILVPANVDDVRNTLDRLYFLQDTQLFEINGFKDMSDEELQGFFLGKARNQHTVSSDPIQRAKQLILGQVEHRELDVHKLADEVAMSYDNFRRRFKQQVGVSPNQFFLTAKIEKAKELLLFTDEEIKNIALQLGFTDPYYFSRVFKERTSVSPAHFRNS